MDFVTLILFLLGFVLLIVGAEILVRGASSLAVSIGISPLVVGLTVVAFGTSAPELAVGVNAALFGEAGAVDVALGNVLGSNIANILLILGIGAVIAPLTVQRQLLRFDVPVMIAASILLLLMSLNGTIGQLEGGVLVLGILLYTGLSLYKSRKKELLKQDTITAGAGSASAEPTTPFTIARDLAFVAGGLLMLVFGSDWLVNGATAVALVLGISEFVIGLTIVAVGTSLPEIATTIAATIKGERDIAVGNAVGSNIFNILLILGVTSILTSGGLPVSAQALMFDFPVFLAVAIVCIPIFYTRWEISRWEGVLFLCYYGAYVTYLVLSGMGSSWTPAFTTVTGWLVVASMLVVIVDLVRSLRQRQRPAVKQGEQR